jgi:CRP-like cAMP-binding protein
MYARNVVATNPFFAGLLTDDELDDLAAHSVRHDFPRGNELIREDDAGTSLFIIIEGEVDIDTGDRETGKHIARLGPGAVVGEMSLMTGARRSATVTARTDVRALEVTKAALEPILHNAPELVDRFATMLKSRQAELDHAYGGRLSGMTSALDFSGLIRGFFGVRT